MRWGSDFGGLFNKSPTIGVYILILRNSRIPSISEVQCIPSCPQALGPRSSSSRPWQGDPRQKSKEEHRTKIMAHISGIATVSYPWYNSSKACMILV